MFTLPGFVSCMADRDGMELSDKFDVSVVLEPAPETRTQLGYDDGEAEYFVRWTSDDKMGVFLRGCPINRNNEYTCDITNGSFHGYLSQISPGNYTLYGYYPRRAECSGDAIDGIEVEITNIQSATQTSFDGGSDVLVTAPDEITINNPQEAVTGEFACKRMGAVIKFVVKNNSTALKLSSGEIVKSIRMEVKGASPKPLTGCRLLNLETAEFCDGFVSHSEPYVKVELNDNTFTLGDGTVNNATLAIVYPQTIPAQTDIEFTVTTWDNVITKTITLSNDLPLPRAEVTTFTINIDDDDSCAVKAPAYVPVTGVEDIVAGSTYYLTVPTSIANKYLVWDGNVWKGQLAASEFTYDLANGTFDKGGKKALPMTLVATGTKNQYRMKIGDKYLTSTDKQKDMLALVDSEAEAVVWTFSDNGALEIKCTVNGANLYLTYFSNQNYFSTNNQPADPGKAVVTLFKVN